MEERIWHQFYDERVPASIDFEDVALPRLLDRTAAEYGDATALTFLNCRLTSR